MRPVRKADNCHHPVPLSRNLGTLTSYELQACKGTALPLPLIISEIEFSRQIFEKYSNINLHGNPSGGRNEDNINFSHFRNDPKSDQNLIQFVLRVC